MPNDEFCYDILAQEALRGVVRTVLRRVEKRGLPGDHHFVLTFDTTAPGVSLSKRLLERYPQEMTIVIQYQFWGLTVYDNAFEIGLSFNNVPETLVIPFRAMKSFQDPSVGFMLQFTGLDASGETGAHPDVEVPAETPEAPASGLPTPAEPALPGPAQPSPSGTGETETAESVVDTATRPDNGEDQENQDNSANQNKGAEVVNLDAFRKK